MYLYLIIGPKIYSGKIGNIRREKDKSVEELTHHD